MKDHAYNSLRQLRDDWYESQTKLQEIAARHPYKVSGQPETYNQYNEGWTDACGTIQSIIKLFHNECNNKAS